MKKIYLGLGAAVLSSGMIAQQNSIVERVNKTLLDATKLPSEKLVLNNQEKASVTIWSDDFSGTGVWTLDNAGQTGNNFGWNINATSEAWFSAFTGGMNSTSGGNYAEVQNGDYNADNQAIGVVYTMTTTNAIDVVALSGGNASVSLQFEQYGSLFNDGQTIEVSTDGNIWTEVGSNNDRTTYVGNNPSAIYPNPEEVTFNITNAIAGDPTNVFIRFVWTSRFATSSATGAWTTFGWYIDDVKIITNEENQLTLDAPIFGSTGAWGVNLPYYQIPTSQVTAIDFGGIVTNNGAANQPNTAIEVDINSGSFTSASATGFSSISGATDTLMTTTSYTPASTVGSHNFTLEVVSDSVDAIPGDNMASGSFDVTDFSYARDNGSGDGTTWNQGEGYELGNIFDIYANTDLYGMNVGIASNSNAGALIYAKVYSIDAATGDFIFLDQSDDYTVTNADLGSEVSLFFNNAISLTAGEPYLLVVGSYGDAGATNDLVVTTGGTAEAQTVFLYDGPQSTWFYSTSIPQVRMNFDQDAFIAAGVENNDLEGFKLGQNIPNPFTNNSMIKFEIPSASDVTFTVTDMSGKVIEVLNMGTLSAGNHNLTINANEYASGVYYYTMTAGTVLMTNKMFVQK